MSGNLSAKKDPLEVTELVQAHGERSPPAPHPPGISTSDRQPGAPQAGWYTCFWGAWKRGHPLMKKKMMMAVA